MAPDAGRDDREQRVHGLAVERGEVDGVLEEAERRGRGGGVEDDGIAHMGNGDAVADRGGSQRFTGQENLQQELPVHRGRHRNQVHDRGERLGFPDGADAAVDPSGLESGGQRHGFGGRPRALGPRLLEQVRVDGDALGGGPLEELRPVETVLALDLVAGEAARFQPAVDGLLGDREQVRGPAYVDLHSSLCSRVLSVSINVQSVKRPARPRGARQLPPW